MSENTEPEEDNRGSKAKQSSETRRRERTRLDAIEADEHIEFLTGTLGLSDEQLESLSLQIKEHCAPSFNTRRKRILRFMRAVYLYEKECKGLIRAQKRFNELMGPLGTTPEPIFEKKEQKALRDSGLSRFTQRRAKMFGQRGSMLPRPSDYVSGNPEKDWWKLIREISIGEAPFCGKKVEQLLKCGAVLKQTYNGRGNNTK